MTGERLVVLLLYALMVAAIVYFSTGAKTYGHDWYDAACCRERTNYGGDCSPAKDGDVQVRPDGFYIQSYGMFVSKGSDKIHLSIDDKFHVCGYPKGENGRTSSILYCLYVPAGGV